MKDEWGTPHLSRPVSLTVVLMCAASALALGASMASAQSPVGGAVAQGGASIAHSGAATVINQTTERAVIDWQSFNVGRDQRVDFQQPGRSAATLNRVQSHQPSLIEGAITAPGTVVIQNTAGVTFTGTARVDAGGLLATSQIVDADQFMQTGNFRIEGGERAGARVENAGRFTIDAEGLAALVGSNVTNSGTIVAHMGTVVLASGDTTAIDLAGDGVFQVAVAGAPAGGAVTQSGQVDVSSGRVLITAGGAAGMLDSVINTSGVTRAVSGSGTGGRIELVGRGGGQVNVAGTLQASGATQGGQITVTGETVALTGSASVDASGARGGEIRIGGDLQGSGDLRRSQRTVLNTGSEIRADGTSGAGGRVIVWSDGDTWFDAVISATGTTDGGFVETSGKNALGTGNAAEVQVGPQGQWLLDPRNVRIANTGTNIGGGVTNPPDDSGTFQIRRASITNALNAGSDVTITTAQPNQSQDGNITVDSALRWTGDGSLTLLADNSIRVNSAIDARGDGALTLVADADIDARNSLQTRGTGDITLTAGTSLATRAVRAFGGGDVTLNASTDVTTAGTIEARAGGTVRIETDGAVSTGGTVLTRNSGDLTIVAGTTLDTAAVRTQGSGAVVLTAGSDITTSGTVETRGGGNLTIDSGGAVTLNRNVQTQRAGNIDIDGEGDIAFNRNVQARGSGNLDVTGGGTLTVKRTAQTRGGDFTINVAGDIQLTQAITSRNGGSVRAEADGSIFVDRSTRMRGSGDMTLIAGDRIEVNQQIRRDGAGDLTLQAGNDITIDQNVFAGADGSINILTQTGDIAFGGSNGNQRISTNRGDIALTATTGSIEIARTNTRPRNTQVFASNGDISLTAGTEILLQGGAQNRSFARIGRGGDASNISLAAPTVSVLAGDVSNQGSAQVITGAGGSISVDADLLQIETGATGARASLEATNGASLTLDAGIQRWDGLVRANGTAPLEGDITLIGNITASVAPVFDSNDGASFSLNVGNPGGSFDLTGLSFDVTTQGGTIGVDGGVTARDVVLTSDTGITFGAGTALRATAASDAVAVISAGPVAVDGTFDANDISVISDTSVTFGANTELTATGPGTALVVSAADTFRNNGGPDVLAVTDPSARWLLYINSFAGLEGPAPTSGTFDLYNRSFSATPPADLDAFPGNRIVYAEQPTLTITADDLSKTYGTDGTALLSVSTDGLRAGDTITNALDGTVLLDSDGADATANVPDGPYAIETTANASDQGYAVETVDGLLTVTPAPLTVTANDASRPVGAPNPDFDAEITGFVLGEDNSDLGGALTFFTSATEDSPDGLFPITPSGLTAQNYAITFVDGTLTVGTGTPPLPELPPAVDPEAPDATAGDTNDAGAQNVRRLAQRGAPVTPGDATFRISNRDVALAEADPFALTYSLGEVLAFSTEIAPPSDTGFVPAAGETPQAESFESAAGGAAETAACGASVNLGTADRGNCQQVTVSESYWVTR